MSSTLTAATGLALRVPDDTDRVSDAALAMRTLGTDTANLMSRGFVGENEATAPVTLAVVGTTYEMVASRVSIAAKPVQRRYRITCFGQVSAASAVSGLYRVGAMVNSSTGIGRPVQLLTNVAGGPGQVSGTPWATYLVPANTAVVFSMYAVRSAGGSATDQAVVGSCSVDDIGGA